MEAKKYYVTIPTEGAVAVEHKLSRVVCGAVALPDPDGESEGDTPAFDVSWNRGKYVTVSGRPGAKCIVTVFPDNSVTATLPTGEGAPAPGHGLTDAPPPSPPVAARRVVSPAVGSPPKTRKPAKRR